MDSEQTSNILDTISTNNYGSMLMVAKNYWCCNNNSYFNGNNEISS